MSRAPRASCERVRGRLVALLEGELADLLGDRPGAVEEARDRGHLEACADCARELAELEHLRRSIRALPRASAAELANLHAEILARLPAPVPARAPQLARNQRARFVLAAAAAVLLALLWSFQGLPSAPRISELARLDAWLAHLPAWSELLHGLGALSRPLG